MILPTCGWQEGRNEHVSCLRLAILGDICKINGFCTLFPLLLPSLTHKRTWYPEEDSYFETLVCHLLGQPNRQITPCLNTSSPIHWPVMQPEGQAWTW